MSLFLRQNLRWKWVVFMGFGWSGIIFFWSFFNFFSSYLPISISRRLLEKQDLHDEFCEQTASWETQWGVVVYILGLIYLFIGLAIVCDDFFVASLEKITEGLKLSEDVAGATFMAAGSSAPELFVSLADNVFTKPGKSMGIGAIVGSAIFNILIIIALSALLAGQVLHLDWRPMCRDFCWYSYSIAVLCVVIWDGHVNTMESLWMFLSYIGYILYMSQNAVIMKTCCYRNVHLHKERNDESIEESIRKESIVELTTSELEAAEYAAKIIEDRSNSKEQFLQNFESSSSTSKSMGNRPWTIDVERVQNQPNQSHLPRKNSDPTLESSLDPVSSLTTAIKKDQSTLNPIYRSKYRMFQHERHHTPLPQAFERSSNTEQDPSSINEKGLVNAPIEMEAKEDLTKDMEEGKVSESYFQELWDLPTSWMGRIWFVFTWPLVFFMKCTIPDCRFPIFSHPLGYTMTFVTSIVWISFLSHFTLFFSTRIGCITHIPFSIMGLTIVAAGTSIPDALSSVLVARAGQGDMAVSNAIGSNVFDILLGLGLPFLLSNLVYHSSVRISTEELLSSIIILFGVLFSVLILLLISQWKLHRVIGLCLLGLYILYVIYAYLHIHLVETT